MEEEELEDADLEEPPSAAPVREAAPGIRREAGPDLDDEEEEE